MLWERLTSAAAAAPAMVAFLGVGATLTLVIGGVIVYYLFFAPQQPGPD